jgi:type III restriction enzyme
MTSIRKQIKDRMSLRKPQEASLECLEHLVKLIPMTLATDLQPIEERVRQAFPKFEAFERNFPNICFALATGVGKTRLMGAMIAYLAEAKEIRNFVVLAPNITITEKLVREFSQTKDPKYVFKGLPEFANRTPRIITGENYENMSSLLAKRSSDDFNPESITINIFNIALLHTKERRIRRPNENIDASMSYFDYLASQNDLVVFMDEAHHCRAKAGARTIEELNPILGIELTATPQTQSSKGEVPFRNVVYRFTLPEALKAGYLKRLGIGGRSNFDCSTLSDDALERLKLEDGLTVHRNLQAELWNYTRQRNIKPVKPFVLVIARDTAHANQIEELIKSPMFLGGRYSNKVLTVHSQQSGEEKEETVRQLLGVESPENPTEIVIHVNMLREGWDVSNLYTIIPLRRAKSLTLIEQSLGRGARLPFGKRTGIDLIDRLYVVYHENFQKVVSEAAKYLEVIENIDIGEFPPEPPKPVIVYPVGTRSLEPTLGLNTDGLSGEFPTSPSPEPETEEILPSQHLKIPRIIIQPDPGAKQGNFLSFTLNLQGFGPQPVDPTIVFIDTTSKEKTKFHSKISSYIEQKPENVITNDLLDRDGVADTEENGTIVSDLALQMVQHLRSYLTEDMVKLVVHQHRSTITDKIYRQMQENYEPGEEKMVYSIGKGFLTFGSVSYLIAPDQEPEHYREALKGRNIESVIWSGFEKSIYPMTKFHSEAERQFSAMLESDEEIISWVKPPKGKFWIYYRKDTTYEPDFVVETRYGKYLCEVKDRTKIEDSIVKEKAKAAAYWCQAANECTDKEWKYLLIPDSAINLTTTFAAYASRHEWRVRA